jgi:peptidyl-prolyl cis-trans isomerase C
MVVSMRARAALLAVLVLAGCRKTVQDPPILSLGDQTIRRSEFDKHLKALESQGAVVAPEARGALLESFLEERVLVLEARTRGLVNANTSDAEEQRAVQRMLADDVLSKVTVVDDEIAAYYKAHAQDFHVPERVALRQILVGTEGEALEVQRHLQRDPTSFAALARAQSKSPEGPSGGVMGTFSRGELPSDLETPAFALGPNGTDIVKTPLGYHVLKVDSHQPARDLSLDDARGEIRGILSREKSDQSVKELVRELMARAKVNHEAATQSQSPS